MSNNHRPEFTDEEVMTIYLFGILQKYTEVKDIYQYTAAHLLSWFPKLPSYQAFNARLNNLCYAFEILINEIMGEHHLKVLFGEISLVDSLPIVVAGNSRSSTARTARELCNKGYCSSKDLYYHGLKLHSMNFVRKKTIPFPEYFWLTPAEENDLTAARPLFRKVSNRILVGDKIYADSSLNEQMRKQQNAEIITPIKKKKGQQLLDAADQLYSRAVSKIRQPIESFFQWLNEKTSIQNATKVRSAKGLLVHVFGKIAAALFLLTVFNFNS